MDAINALDSSAPIPKKKRENKPLTKPPAKRDVQPRQSDRTSNEKGTVLGGDVTQTPAENGKGKKNRSRKTASLDSSDAINSNTDTTEVTSSSFIPSPLKEPLEEENVNVAPHSEVKIDRKSDKKKKKKKKMKEDALGENLKEILEHGIEEEINKESIAPNNKICNDHENKKDAKGNVDDGKELIGNLTITESIVQQKKLKKKKKNKSEDILEQKTEGEIYSEKTAEEENTAQSKKAKKKKKKEKIDADSPEKIIRAEDIQMVEPETEEKEEENSEQISDTKKRKKKRKHREGDAELVVENRKMIEEQKDEENVTNPFTDKEENHERTAELNRKNKKASVMKNDSVVLTPLQPGQETLGLPSEKKKSE